MTAAHRHGDDTRTVAVTVDATPGTGHSAGMSEQPADKPETARHDVPIRSVAGPILPLSAV